MIYEIKYVKNILITKFYQNIILVYIKKLKNIKILIYKYKFYHFKII